MKTYISNLVQATRFWNNLYQVTLKVKIFQRQIFLKVVESKKTKGPKHDSQNRLRSFRNIKARNSKVNEHLIFYQSTTIGTNEDETTFKIELS